MPGHVGWLAVGVEGLGSEPHWGHRPEWHSTGVALRPAIRALHSESGQRRDQNDGIQANTPAPRTRSKALKAAGPHLRAMVPSGFADLPWHSSIDFVVGSPTTRL